MLTLWLVALAMTSFPVLGFGLYYKGERCVRYREATEPSDVAYAYVWFVFGKSSIQVRQLPISEKHYIALSEHFTI